MPWTPAAVADDMSRGHEMGTAPGQDIVRVKRHLVLLLAAAAGILTVITLVNPRQPDRAAPAAGNATPVVDLPTPAALAVPSTSTTEATVVAAVTAAAAPAAPIAPVRIRIDAIKASAPVDPLGLNADGSLQVPKDFSRAGYYTGRPPPGAIGAAIIVAHVDSRAGPAVFYRLDELKPGDEVTVTRADGSDVVFVVDRVEQHPKNAFPTKAVYDPTPDAALRLITCGGSFDRSSRHYRDNVIAFAHLRP